MGSRAITLCSRGSSRKLGPRTLVVKEEKEVIMANLSSDLNSYLSRSTSTSSINSVTSKLSAFKLPTLNTMKSFGGGGGQQEDEEPFLGVQVDDGSSSGSSGGSQSWFARKADEWLPSLSKKQRIIGFMTSLILGMICFGLAVSLLPMLMINPRKFSLLFSLGSAFTLSSFPFCGGLIITWCTCSVGRGFPSQASTSPPSSSPSTLRWASSLQFSLQLQHVLRLSLLFGLLFHIFLVDRLG